MISMVDLLFLILSETIGNASDMQMELSKPPGLARLGMYCGHSHS